MWGGSWGQRGSDKKQNCGYKLDWLICRLTFTVNKVMRSGFPVESEIFKECLSRRKLSGEKTNQ